MDASPTVCRTFSIPLQSERLVLRPIRVEDLEDAEVYYGDPELHRYLPSEPQRGEALRRTLAAKAAKNQWNEDCAAFALALERKSDRRVIGEVALFNLCAEHAQGELGFLLSPDCQGRGYMREAVLLVLTAGFSELRLHRIWARTDARNTRSCRLLEEVGMRREAHLLENEWLKGAWASELHYAMLDRELGAPRLVR